MSIAGLAPLIVCISLASCAADGQLSRPPNMALRQLDGNMLVSPDQPNLRLHVDKAFTALPVLAFPIRRDTWAERYVFVDSAPDKTIRRLVIVQFEHALPGSSFRFVYPSRPPMQWGGAVYRYGTFTADNAREIAENPDLEVGQTQRFLVEKGYRVGNWWHVARLARVADADGKTEIIVFYQESLALAPGSAPPGNADALPDELAQRLLAHLNAAVTAE